MSDSRIRIVEILKRRTRASVTELSRALGLTPVTVRHHLEGLIHDGVVAEPTSRRRAGPGRPEMVYALTEAADRLTPRNYGELCACLLASVDEVPASRSGLLQAAGARLAGEAGGRSGSRMSIVLERLDRRGYYPSLEQKGGVTTVVLANCPYLEVARDSQEVCQFDQALLRGWLNRPVAVEARIAEGAPACRLRLEPMV